MSNWLNKVGKNNGRKVLVDDATNKYWASHNNLIQKLKPVAERQLFDDLRGNSMNFSTATAAHSYALLQEGSQFTENQKTFEENLQSLDATGKKFDAFAHEIDMITKSILDDPKAQKEALEPVLAETHKLNKMLAKMAILAKAREEIFSERQALTDTSVINSRISDSELEGNFNTGRMRFIKIRNELLKKLETKGYNDEAKYLEDSVGKLLNSAAGRLNPGSGYSNKTAAILKSANEIDVVAAQMVAVSEFTDELPQNNPRKKYDEETKETISLVKAIGTMAEAIAERAEGKLKDTGRAR